MAGESVFKRILVPVDESVPSLNAQELAAFIAKKFHSEVTVIYVVAHELMIPKVASLVSEVGAQEYARTGQGAISGVAFPPTVPGPKSVISEMTSWYHQKADEVIAEAKRLFNEEGLSVNHIVIEHRDPGDTIISKAEENYDLIIMGRSGDEKKRLHLGSVTEKVARHADAPILVTGKKREISSILVAFDGSEDAEKALTYASAIAKKSGARMTVIYVQEAGLFNLKPDTVTKIGNRILSQAADKVKDVKFDQRIESGDPSDIITAIAEKEDYDLIVLGNKGQGGIRRFLLGSVSDHVLHYSDHAVLIAR
jgi:nucleotide-binding universal stress UspA family protein